MTKDNSREDAIVAANHATSAAACLAPGSNPWAALGFLLDAQTKLTHALDALSEELGEINPSRVDRIYAGHGRHR